MSSITSLIEKLEDRLRTTSDEGDRNSDVIADGCTDTPDARKPLAQANAPPIMNASCVNTQTAEVPETEATSGTLSKKQRLQQELEKRKKEHAATLQMLASHVEKLESQVA